MKTYNAHGKVLLTGEYMILDGAVGIGLPTHHGQILIIDTIESDTPHILRTAYDQGGERFHGSYDKSSRTRTHTTDEGVSQKLSSLFAFDNYAGLIHRDNISYHIITNLSYPRQRGLGSSSTLISLYAQLIDADPFAVHQHQHPRGSGYDVACAGAVGPLLFQKTPPDPFLIQSIDRRPPFADSLYFAYSGTKQDSNDSVTSYRASGKPSPDTLEKITSITHQIIKTDNRKEFSSLIHEHESIIADHLQTQPIQISRFADAPVGLQTKSLGGRGGDFLLVIRPGEKKILVNYLATKNISNIFSRNEFIL